MKSKFVMLMSFFSDCLSKKYLIKCFIVKFYYNLAGKWENIGLRRVRPRNTPKVVFLFYFGVENMLNPNIWDGP